MTDHVSMNRSQGICLKCGHQQVVDSLNIMYSCDNCGLINTSEWALNRWGIKQRLNQIKTDAKTTDYKVLAEQLANLLGEWHSEIGPASGWDSNKYIASLAIRTDRMLGELPPEIELTTTTLIEG